MNDCRGLLVLAASLLTAPLLGQGHTASLIDLSTNTVVAHFLVGKPGDNPIAVAWAGNSVAYVVNDDGNALVRLDMTTSPPSISGSFAFPAGFGPHGLAINPSNTRALVSGGGSVVYLLNLTTSPISIADTVPLPVPDASGVAFYSSGTKAVVVDENFLIFLNLSSTPAGVTTVDLGAPGQAVAVNPANTRAAVTMSDGGLQVIDLTSSPPALVNTPVGPSPADPLGVAISPNGSRAIYVDEENPAQEINVVDISGAPTLLNTLVLPCCLTAPSAVAFNPVTAAVLVAADDGVLILNSPYTSISTTITDPGHEGATAYSIAVNLAGSFAIVLNEDRPPIPNTASLIDLTTNTVVSHFAVGDNPVAVAWANNGLAYVVNEEANSLVRLDMTLRPPAISSTYNFPPGYLPHAVALNPSGTRALVSGDSNSVYLLNLSTSPITIADTINAPTSDPGGVAFYSAGSRGIVVDEDQVLFLDLTVVPAAVTTISLGGSQGLAVAVNASGTRAVVTIDTGGLQTINLATSPPTLIGAPVGPSPADALGVAISPDGTRAVYVDESNPTQEINVVSISGSPGLVGSVPSSLSTPSAVAFNPASGAVLVATDEGVLVLNAPYSAVNATILDPVSGGATPYSIAVNPAGTFAIVLNEDNPTLAGTSFYTVTPCRVADTRNPTGSYGGPALAANTDRTFVIAGQCGIPVTASAVAFNLTVTSPTAGGDLRVVPGGAGLPLVSTMNWRAGQTRANNAIGVLGPAGDILTHVDQPSGTAHLIIDVNGYFQ